MKKRSPRIVGTLVFEGKKVILQTKEGRFFVKIRSLRGGYFSGDQVAARVVQKKSGGRMAEVAIIERISYTKTELIGRIQKDGSIVPLSAFGSDAQIRSGHNHTFPPDSLVTFHIDTSGRAQIRDIFHPPEGIHEEIASMLIAQNIPTAWPESFATLQFEKKQWIPTALQKTSPISLSQIRPDTFLEIPHDSFPYAQHDTEIRTDFSSWYTFTIDGSDARDLDDAISIAQYLNGDYLLGVHIADVARYVLAGSELDREARSRGTSIYLPNRVIPMLPEILSNERCSLHPGEKKETLSCLMHIEKKTGRVKHVDIQSGLIESRHRGIYENIWEQYQSLHTPSNPHEHSIQLAFDLHALLTRRRKKEGKIFFDTEEIHFIFSEDTVVGITPRERNDAHKLIEECMVLANEEVARWCSKRQIPFLSRVHEAPPLEHRETIAVIIGKKSTDITPKDIETYLSGIDDPHLLYRSMRLLLPKMAKAVYSDRPSQHFGLALEHYSHFTSPIRRYPDLITHRMIHAYLDRSVQYKVLGKGLETIARLSSETERRAESIEKFADMVYAVEYMNIKLGTFFQGKISGIAEWALFVELENGIEVTVLLPQARYTINPIEGILLKGVKKMHQIGDDISICVDHVDRREYRIFAKIAENRTPKSKS